MTEVVENLILEHLKRFQAGQERIEHELRDVKSHLATLEVGHGSLLQHLGNLAGSIAQQQASIDRMGDRIQRIEKRRELIDA